MVRRDALSIIIATGVSVLASIARAQEPPPPNYVQMPYLGQIDPSTGLLRSFDSGAQRVGIAPYFLEWFYAFNFDSTFGTQGLSGSIDTSTGFGGTIEVQDAGHQNLGPLNGPLSRPLQTGSYFIHVTAVPSRSTSEPLQCRRWHCIPMMLATRGVRRWPWVL
jgi:hypothetical protein